MGAGLGHHDLTAVRGFFADLVDAVYDVDRTVAERAAEPRTVKPSLEMPDALVLATADVHKVDVVITGDHRWADVLVGRCVELLRPAAD